MNPLSKLTGRFDIGDVFVVLVITVCLVMVGLVVIDASQKADCEPPKQIVNQCYYRVYTGKVWVTHNVHCLDTRAESVRQVCR